MSFVLPPIQDNENGWGPVQVPDGFADVPYAPYEKRAYMGRIADWSVRAEQYRERRRHDNRAPQVTNEAFGYAEDSSEGFNLVDTQKGAPPQPGWDRGMRGRGRGRGRGRYGGGRWGAPQPMGAEAKFNAKFEKKRIPQAAQSKWKKSQQANYQQRWNEQKPTRIRDSSVDVRPEWQVKGQISFMELSKMQMDVPAAEELHACGTLQYYDKAFDRVNVKSEKPLERIERAFYKVSTSDDPEIARLASTEAHKGVRVFATDAILSVLMSAPRSAFSWDVIVNRVGDRLFLDKRPNSTLDYVTCNETAHDFGDDDRESINHTSKLTTEATFINQNFSQQVLLGKEKTYPFPEPTSPFAGESEPAPVGYRYRKFVLGKPPAKGSEDADQRVQMLVRTELDGVMQGKNEGDEDLLLRLYALNEVDAKLSNGIDWRQKLESQRGAVLATELKNNSAKLAKWTLQATLAGADLIKLGYVSRVHTRDSYNHVILGTQTYKPKEFATQINLNLNNSWGILKGIIDLCLNLEEGRYLLLKDPNKPVMRLYTIPLDAFVEEEADEDEGDEAD